MPSTLNATEQTSNSASCNRNGNRTAILNWLLVAASVGSLNLLLCEVFVRYLILVAKPASSPNAQLDSKFRVAASVSKTDDNVILCGDSLMKQGLYPELLELRLRKFNSRLRVVNLAHTGGTQRNAISYLEYLRNRGVRPRMVIYDYSVGNTGLPPNADCDAGQYRSYLFRGLLSRPANAKEFCEVLPSDCFHFVRQRGTLKRYIDNFAATIFNLPKFRETSSFPVGFMAEVGVSNDGMMPVHRLTTETNMEYEKKLLSSIEQVSPRGPNFKYNPDSCSVIVDYCQKHQIPIMLVWLPLRSSLLEMFYYKAPYTEAWFKDQFRHYRAGSDNLFTECISLPEDVTYYVDFVHLNTYGCIKASEQFADILSQPKYRNFLRDTAL